MQSYTNLSRVLTSQYFELAEVIRALQYMVSDEVLNRLSPETRRHFVKSENTRAYYVPENEG